MSKVGKNEHPATCICVVVSHVEMSGSMQYPRKIQVLWRHR